MVTRKSSKPDPETNKPKRKAPRTAASGGPPVPRRKSRPGNPGYAGYEYQIEVTIWAALELMLAKELTEAVVIEPPSDEDFQAALQDPDKALLQGTALTPTFELVLQAKSRSTAPWTSVAFADVLTGGTHPKTQGRTRPLDLLALDNRRRYVFVTNEAVDAALRPHAGDQLLDFDDVGELPPHTRKGLDSAMLIHFQSWAISGRVHVEI